MPFPNLRRFSGRYIAPRWRWYVAGTLAVLLTNWMAVRIPVELALGLDALRASEVPTVSTAAWHIFALGAAIIVVRTASRLWFFTPARLAEFDLREDLFATLLALQPDFYAKYRTGDLLSRATTDITFARAFAGFATLQGANIIAALATAIGQMTAFSPKLTLLTLVPVTLGFLFVRKGSESLMGLQRDTQRQGGLYADQLLGALQGIATIQAFSVEEPFAERLGERAERLRKNNIALAQLRALVFPLFTVSGGIAIFLLLGFGGEMVLAGELTAGQLAAFLSLIAYLIMPLRLMGFLLPVFQRAEASLERIHALVDAPVRRPERDQPLAAQAAAPAAPPMPALGTPRVGTAVAFAPFQGTVWRSRRRRRLRQTLRGTAREGASVRLASSDFRTFGPICVRSAGAGPRAPSVHIAGLSFTYDAKPTLLDVSLDVPAGSSLGVFGRSGAGKSTLLRVLSRLENPPRGTVFVDGVDITALDLDRWRERMVLVPQAAWLFSETIAENVALGLPASVLPEAVRDAALDPDLASLPDGIQTVVGERGIVLSGGQRQRVALARGLAYGARGTDRLLLFDDVLSAVDHHTEQLLIHTLLGRGASRPTCILVTHRMSALQHCDRVVVLDAGRIVQSGTHTELLAAPGVYKEAWDTQQGSGEVA